MSSRSWRFWLGVLVAVAPLALGLFGMLLVFAFDPLWPAQDMTPQMEAAYRKARAESDFEMAVVSSLAAFGVLWLALLAWWRRRRRRARVPIAVRAA